MRVERIAVATVVLCVGILLLSACGIGYTDRRPVVYQDFVLVAHGQPDRAIGVGNVNSKDPTQLRAYITLFSPPCTRDTTLFLTGAATAGNRPRIDLHTLPGSNPATLEGPLPHLSNIFGADSLPFEGTLNLQGACGTTQVVAVEVRRKPELTGVWQGTVAGPGGKPVQVSMTLSFYSSGIIEYIYGALNLYGPTCSAHNTSRDGAFMKVSGDPLALSFQMSEGSTVSFHNDVSPLLMTPQSALHAAFSGACPTQGKPQSFEVELRRH